MQDICSSWQMLEVITTAIFLDQNALKIVYIKSCIGICEYIVNA